LQPTKEQVTLGDDSGGSKSLLVVGLGSGGVVLLAALFSALLVRARHKRMGRNANVEQASAMATSAPHSFGAREPELPYSGEPLSTPYGSGGGGGRSDLRKNVTLGSGNPRYMA
jgi:hypothetical protein